MTTNHYQLLTPEWESDSNPPFSPLYDSAADGALHALGRQNDLPIDPRSFGRPSHDGFGSCHSTPQPLFDDFILYPEDNDLQPAAGGLLFGASAVLLAVAHPALLQYGPDEGAALELADLSDLGSEIPGLPPTLASQSYPTPGSSASPPASQPVPGPGVGSGAGPKRNDCAHCGASFPTARKLHLHTDKHTLPFVCVVPSCGKAHARKKDLQRHMWSHHEAEARRLGIPPVRVLCPSRGCSFQGRKDNVKRHVETKHRGELGC